MAATSAPVGTTDDDLRQTLAGIELAAATVHDAIVATGLLDPTTAALVTAFAGHHRDHAAAYTQGLPGEGAVEADSVALDALFTPVFGAADAAGLLRGALVVEAAMTATALDACGRLGGPEPATVAARVAAVEARHHAILGTALALPPGTETETGSTVPTLASLLDG